MIVYFINKHYKIPLRFRIRKKKPIFLEYPFPVLNKKINSLFAYKSIMSIYLAIATILIIVFIYMGREYVYVLETKGMCSSKHSAVMFAFRGNK